MVLVLVYLLYFGIYMAGYNMLTDEISQSLYSKTSYLTNTLEEEIRRIQKLQFECINDDIIFLYHQCISHPDQKRAGEEAFGNAESTENSA